METNEFVIGGIVELKPLIKVSEKSGKKYCRLQVVQTRLGGANYDVENKRYYNLVIFNQDTIELIEAEENQFHAVVRGNIGINYGGKQAFDLNLIGEKIEIHQHSGEPFKSLNKKAVKKPVEAKPQPKVEEVLVGIDEEELPF